MVLDALWFEQSMHLSHVMDKGLAVAVGQEHNWQHLDVRLVLMAVQIVCSAKCHTWSSAA